MAECRFCKRHISDEARRCPYCTSFLGEQEQTSPGQITYVVDKGLVTFAKFAAAILAIFLTVGIFFYGIDVKQLKKEIDDTQKDIESTHADSQKLELSIKQAKLDLDQDSTALKKDVETAEASAKEASETSSRARSYLQEAEQSKEHIHQYELTLIALPQGAKLQSGTQVSQLTENNSEQFEHIVDLKLLEIFKDILPQDKYAALQGKISTKTGLRRQVFDSKNTDDMPGDLVRKEGDPSVSDSAVNEAYDNIEITYRFYKEIFGRESLDNRGKTLVATVHFSKDYDNAFWNGQQLVFGDGDGQLFRQGGFTSSLDVIAAELTHAVVQYTAQLPYHGQAGALNQSISHVFGSMVKQWANKQTADQADWLLGAGLFTSKFKGRALTDVANPGTAYDDPVLGKDPQPGHMKDYVQTSDDNGGVHINSGIPDRAFVLAAKAIGGYSWEKAGKIWYVTTTQRTTSDADFSKFANETVSAARELFPDDPSIAMKVGEAWTDVGVLTAGPTPSSTK